MQGVKVSSSASLIITNSLMWYLCTHSHTYASTHSRGVEESNPESFLSLKGWGLLCRLRTGALLCSCVWAGGERYGLHGKGVRTAPSPKWEPRCKCSSAVKKGGCDGWMRLYLNVFVLLTTSVSQWPLRWGTPAVWGWCGGPRLCWTSYFERYFWIL